MKIIKSLLMLGSIAAVAFLQSPMTQTTIEARGGALIALQKIPQVPVAVCNIGGYASVSCAENITGCTAGTFKGVLINQGGTSENFKDAGTDSVRGDCTGNASCKTPSTPDITSVGC